MTIYVIFTTNAGVQKDFGYFTDEDEANDFASTLNERFSDLYDLYCERTEVMNALQVRENTALELIGMHHLKMPVVEEQEFGFWMSMQGHSLYTVASILEAGSDEPA